MTTMTVEQAMEALAELVEAGGIAHYERALSVISTHIEREAVVTDEMVDLACEAYNAELIVSDPALHHAMYAALTAAMEARDGGG